VEQVPVRAVQLEDLVAGAVRVAGGPHDVLEDPGPVAGGHLGRDGQAGEREG
jgi:hypothetical protein